MGCHVHMPESFALDATLADLSTNDTLGDIIVFRGGNPAATCAYVFPATVHRHRPCRCSPPSPDVGSHSYSGSVYTEVRLDRWGPRDCTVVLQTTVVGNADLQFLATSNGTSCAGLALLIFPALLWERAGAITAVSPTVTTANVFGFANNFTVHAVGASPVPFAKGGPASWALPLAPASSTAGVVGYSTGESPLTISEMQAAIAAAGAAQAAALQKWGPELAPVYEPQGACW